MTVKERIADMSSVVGFVKMPTEDGYTLTNENGVITVKNYSLSGVNETVVFVECSSGVISTMRGFETLDEAKEFLE